MSWFRWPRWLLDPAYDAALAQHFQDRLDAIIGEDRDTVDFVLNVQGDLRALEVLPYDPESLGTDGGRSAP